MSLDISLAVQDFQKSYLWMQTDFLCDAFFKFFFKALNNVAKDKKGSFCSKWTRFTRRKKDLKRFSTTCPGKVLNGLDFI